MKILAFSDLHVDLDAARELVAASGDADVVIGAGDFASMHEGLDRAIGGLVAIDAPTLLVPGNNETDDALREVAAGWSTATVLHGEAAEVDGLSVFGLGAGIPTTPWDWSFDLTDDEAEATLADAPGDLDLLILHSPPQGHVDTDGSGTSLGSPAIAAAIERLQPKLAVCGHIHDSWGGRSRIGETEIANLGPAGAWFEL
ncbi:serine/threonine protein phosphatase [Thermoleophilia bacterium SCSIO 60948]|nr:serine/threonine protein phosphatase [Thermoleophilia bacterium SCSIO 60948]